MSVSNKIMTKSCGGCQIKGLINIFDVTPVRNQAPFVSSFGPQDDDGLNQIFVYCRRCHQITAFKPGWFANWKLAYTMDPKLLYAHYVAGSIRHEEIGILSKNIQLALVEDGVFPENWVFT